MIWKLWVPGKFSLTNKMLSDLRAAGLHAIDCECPTCDAGYRPTELERACARRALAARAALGRPTPKNKRQAAELVAKERHREEVGRTAEAASRILTPVAPLTPEERAEVQAMIRKVGR
jgi:hypothetical protein